jgi:hypothetical protein
MHTALAGQPPSLTILGGADSQVSTMVYGMSRSGNAIFGYDESNYIVYSPLTGRQPIDVSVYFPEAISPDGDTLLCSLYTNQSAFGICETDGTLRTAVGRLAGHGPNFSSTKAIGNDGAWILTSMNVANDDDVTPYRWTAPTGWQPIFGPQRCTYVRDVSPDGRIFVGDTVGGSQGFSFRYTTPSGYENVLPLEIRATSDTGHVAVGNVADLSTPVIDGDLGILRGNVLQVVQRPPGIATAYGLDVSNDGRFVVGLLSVPGDSPDPIFVWTPERGIQTIYEYCAGYGIVFPEHSGVRGLALWTNDEGTVISGVYGNGVAIKGFYASLPRCDSIDFNNDGLFPSDEDLIDFLVVLAGGTCSNAPNCNDIDFNNDKLFPSDEDLIAYLRVLAGGTCW